MIGTAVLAGLSLFAFVLVVLCAMLAAEVALAWHARARLSEAAKSGGGARPRVAVLIPAHNEAAGIAATLRSVRSQLRPGDVLLVVADNCSDDTAAVARGGGAEVVERADFERRGKGYALDHGLQCIEQGGHEVVVMVDADCQLDEGCIDALARSALANGRPVQARNLIHAGPEAGPAMRLAEFAWRLKNMIRPLGAQAMGCPCLLTGTGMAFPRASLQGVALASGNIVEDMQLGLDLARRGYGPAFVPEAVVRSRFAAGDGALSQRVRWEHGHLATLVTQVPGLLGAAVRRGDVRLVGLAADLAVPPLALLLLLVTAAWVSALVAWLLLGAGMALMLATTAALLLAVAVLFAWRWQGRDLVSGRELLQVPSYALAKLPLYLRFARGQRSKWVRAKRHGE